MGKSNIKIESGQSLIELIIAVAVAAMAILATVSILALILRISEEDVAWQTATFLQERLADGAAVTIERNWQEAAGAVLDGRYRLATTTEEGVFELIEGEGTETIGGVVYTQFLTIAEVKRDGNGDITDIGVVDPSTKKMDIVVAWPTRDGTATSTISRYVTHINNQVFSQTDWSGGGTSPGDPAVNITNNFLKASSTIDFSSEPGALKVR